MVVSGLVGGDLQRLTWTSVKPQSALLHCFIVVFVFPKYNL